MFMNRNSPIIIALLVMVIAIGYWAYEGTLHSSAPKKTQTNKQNPDYFLEQASIFKYDQKGRREYRLISDNISHYPHSDTTLLSQPHMTNYRKAGQITETDAINGKLLSGNQVLVLWDNVVMTQNTIKTGKGVRMDTDYLTLYSKQGMAETDKPVLITSDNSIMRAIGMKTFYEKGLIHLKSRVRGIHEPD